jgi:hypothetical protein
MVELFYLVEVKTICFDLNIDYDNLAGETKSDKPKQFPKDGSET